MQIKKSIAHAIFIASLALCLNACDYNNLISDVKEFDKLMSAATTSLKKTYTGVNDFYRKTYIAERRFDVAKKVWVRNNDRGYSELVYKFDPTEIRARELVLQGLTEYSAGLAAIAGSDAPEKASALAAQLSERLTNTASTLSSLKKPDISGKKSFDVSKYSGPIANLARITAKYWVRNMQRAQLKKSVTEGAAPVKATLDLLESDIDNIFESAYNENAELTLLAQQNYYNKAFTLKELETIPDESADDRAKREQDHAAKEQGLLRDKARMDFLNELSASAKELADLKTASPLPLIQSMRAAHETILKYIDADPKSDILKDKVRGATASVTGVLRSISPDASN